MKGHEPLFSSASEHWATPKDLYAELHSVILVFASLPNPKEESNLLSEKR